jgi:hypothetical protein
VNLLNIDKASSDQRTLMAELNESFFESLTAGVRLVADSGQAGFPEFFHLQLSQPWRPASAWWPTAARQGFQNFFVYNFHSIFSPHRLPGSQIRKKDDSVKSILHGPRAHM